MLIEEVNY